MADVGIKELLEAGVHFGHQTRRWNPKMRRFIYGEREGIYIIDLLKTAALLDQAQRFAAEIAHRGGTVLFVGTKKQARDGVRDIASEAGMPYVNHRWLGGLLTNFQTISQRIKRLHDLERYETEGQLALLPTRERLAAQADLEKLRANLGGVKNMQRVPDAVFIIDLKTEAIAVREAQRLRIPIIGLVDTNCDPDGVDYVIPGNDDAIRACGVITRAIGDRVAEGRRVFREEEERARREAEEQARREAEEQARREAEAEAALTQGGEGLPRNEAEAVVAEAVRDLGRPVEGRRQAEAAAAAAAAEEPAMPAVGNVGPGVREEHQNPNVGNREPEGAGARGGQGAPASDTMGQGGGEPPARRARQRARRARQGEPQPAVQPGPSPAAAAAEAAAPPDPDAAVAEAEQVEAAAGVPAPATAPAPEANGAPAPAEAPQEDAAPTEPPAEGGPGVVDRAQQVANQAVDTVQGAANAAVDTAQDVAAGAAQVAGDAAGAVAERAPGPLGGVVGATAGAAEALAGAVGNQDQDQDQDDPDSSEDQSSQENER